MRNVFTALLSVPSLTSRSLSLSLSLFLPAPRKGGRRGGLGVPVDGGAASVDGESGGRRVRSRSWQEKGSSSSSSSFPSPLPPFRRRSSLSALRSTRPRRSRPDPRPSRSSHSRPGPSLPPRRPRLPHRRSLGGLFSHGVSLGASLSAQAVEGHAEAGGGPGGDRRRRWRRARGRAGVRGGGGIAES